jgi:hypothetical protein
MSLSGSNTGALRPYTGVNLLEEACSRAGIPPEGITSEIVEKALDQLNLTLTFLVNRGYQLWKRQLLILPLYEGVNQVPLPPGYNLVTTLNQRSMTRVTGTPFTDQGGTASYAFDDDFDTVCLQTAVDGAIGCEFEEATRVTTIGILSGTTGTFGLFFEWSQDGVTYTAADAADVSFASEGEWFWFDIVEGPRNGALFWRVRSLGTVPFGAAEIFFGNNPSEIYLGAWNIDDYATMPNKTQQGTVTNWYQQRDVSAPTLYVWPTPDAASRYNTLVVWATQYLDQITDLTQGLDFPLRWYDAVTSMLARRLCRTLKEADMKRYPTLVQEEGEALWIAQSEERDPAPVNYDLGVGYYTRL